ncbi:ferric-chelate reductase Frp1 [Saitoella coloradoensis]
MAMEDLIVQVSQRSSSGPASTMNGTGGGNNGGNNSAKAAMAALSLEYAKLVNYTFSLAILIFTIFYAYRLVTLRLSGTPSSKMGSVRRVVRTPGVMWRRWMMRTTRVGKVGLWVACVVYLALNLLFVLNETGGTDLKRVAKRFGRIAAANFPPLFFLSMKNSPLALFMGLSHEKANVLHRWVGRAMLLYVFLHTVLYSYVYTSQGQPERLKKTSNVIGFVGFAACIFLSFGSVRWLRNKFYESFYLVHLAMAGVMLGASWKHDKSCVVWVKASIGIICLDRVFRWMRIGTGVPFRKANVETYPGGIVVLRIEKPKGLSMMRRWAPGSHCFLSLPTLAPGQGHPFTIMSTPEDDSIDILIRARSGVTGTLCKKALAGAQAVPVCVDGPYGHCAAFHRYETVLLIAGGTGIAFSMTVARDLVRRRVAQTGIYTKRVKFIWVITNRAHLSWVRNELAGMLADAPNDFLEVEIRVTREQVLVDEHPEKKPQLLPEAREITSSASSKTESIADESREGDFTEVPSSTEVSLFSLTDKEGISQFDSYVCFGRPNVPALVEMAVAEASELGRMAVGVCGPSTLSNEVANAVSANMTADREIDTFVESFGW